MTKPKARNGADFAAKHVRETVAIRKIEAALARMRSLGTEHWEYEIDLSKPPYGISSNDLAAYRDRFAEFWVRTEVQEREKPYTVWFGDKKIAARYRLEPVGGSK